jgi:hypothetical protein
VIPSGLRTYLYPYLNDDLDILIIGGDFFDSSLDLDSEASCYALQVIHEITQLAIKHNFIIRVLQGTFSHDRHQNKHFSLNQTKDTGIVRVVSEIDIERIEHLGITIMYKPDDLPFKNAHEVIKSHIEESGVGKVDIFVNHGYFEHLLPRGIPYMPTNTLVEEQIALFVKGVILNGHIHSHSIYGKVINNGSFGRLNHGEEEAKGFVYLQYRSDNSSTKIEFIENKRATTFTSVDISRYEENLDDCKEFVKKKLDKVLARETESVKRFVRVIGKDPQMRHAISSYVSVHYPNVTLSSLAKDKVNKQVSSEDFLKEFDDLEALPIITPANVSQFIHDFLKEKKTPLEMDYIIQKLNAIAA